MFKCTGYRSPVLWAVIFILQFYCGLAWAVQSPKAKAGNSKIDSLIAAVPSLMRSNIELAKKTINQISTLSVQANYRHGIIESIFDRDWLLYREGKIDQCIISLDSAIKHIANIYSEPFSSKFNILKGQCYVKKTQYNLAVQEFSVALKIAEKNKDDGGRAGALLSIGWAYMENDKPKDAIDFFLEILKIKSANNYLSKATVLNNIASCYNALAKYKEAVVYAQQGIKQSRDDNNLVDLANGLNILAGATNQLGNTKQALAYLSEASKVREKVDDPAMLASDYLELSDLYRKSGQYTAAVTYAQKAMELSKKNNINLKLVAAYESLANSLEGSGNYKQAAVYYKKLLTYKDSASTAANNKAMSELLVKYNIQKKTTENLQLKQDNLSARLKLVSKQRWLSISIGIAILLVVISVFSYVYTNNRYKTKLAIQQVIEQKNRMLAVLETEENERRRIAGDLHDGVCQMLAAVAIQLKNPNQSISAVQQLLEQATTEVRTVSHQMTPELLKHYGLVKAMESSLARLNDADTGTHFNFFDMVEVRGMDELLQVMLYRSFQELVNNITKHAHAAEVNVHLTINDEMALLLVEDDGIGFDVNSGDGLGLKSLAGRVEVFNGTLTIDSMPGNGTTVIIKFDNPVLT